MLYAMGYKLGNSGVDGDLGSKTEDAVCAYQKKNGLVEDGIVGKNTWTKLLGA
jgi:peptidoglycan hydrolase-like protein with peptidoglycan-binding domain